MRNFPHQYAVNGLARSSDHGVTISSKNLPPLRTDLPANFDGPGDAWSPETLLVAAVADCFSLAFRIVAKEFPWSDLRCEVEGELDRVGRETRFTEFRIRAHLSIPSEADRDEANRLLGKAEHICVITNSVNGRVLLDPHVECTST